MCVWCVGVCVACGVICARVHVCLCAAQGSLPPGTVPLAGSDVIFSQRRGQSQKPTEVYELIEKLVPGGAFLEIFGRRNNLRDFWVTVGNEL